MQIKSNGEEVLWDTFVHRQSLTDYAASLEVTTNLPIGGVVEISDGDVSSEVVGTSYQMHDKSYVTVLRPKSFVDMIDKPISPFKGEFTTEELLEQIGFKTVSVFNTDKVYWEIPSLPFKQFIDHLEMYTQVNKGGGCFINFTIEGYAQISDLKTMSEKDDITTYLLGDFEQMDAEFLWMFDYPGKYQLIQHMPEKTIEREIVFEEGYGKGIEVEMITNEKHKDMRVRYLRNRFYRRFYYKHQAQAFATNSDQFYLSAPVRIKNLTGLIAGVVRDNSTRSSYHIIF